MRSFYYFPDGKKVWYCVAAKDLGRLLRFFHGEHLE